MREEGRRRKRYPFDVRLAEKSLLTLEGSLRVSVGGITGLFNMRHWQPVEVSGELLGESTGAMARLFALGTGRAATAARYVRKSK